MSRERSKAGKVGDHIAAITGILGVPLVGVGALTIAEMIDRSGEKPDGRSYEDFLKERQEVIDRMGTVDGSDFRRRAKAGLKRKEGE